MSDENPLGIIEIDHLEFTCDNLNSPTFKLFQDFGFKKVKRNSQTQSELYTQGHIRFLITANSDPNAHSRKYYNAHGDGVSKISFLVKNAEDAIQNAVKRGAKLVSDLIPYETPQGKIRTASIQGVGDIVNEFVERQDRSSLFPDFENIDNNGTQRLTTPMTRIDHLTNNVPKGEMDHWANFYEQIFGFVETRYFDIKGLQTGLLSKVMQLKNGAVIIPINEPDEKGSKSQIQEYLDLHKGPGVQHIALLTPNIISTLSELVERKFEFLDIPPKYYEDIPKRNFTVEEDISVLKKLSLLVDGDPDGYLLQIFTKNYIGPSFFEIIQRKNHNGFGEGNFQALFDSIEKEQRDRGYLE